MTAFDPAAVIEGIKSGSVIPYLGPGALAGAADTETGDPIPADSDSLILAMNNGRPMAPKLMYEFPRAAMNQELKKGRSFVNKFLAKLYGEKTWSRAPLHDWLAAIRPPVVIDINRDLMLQDTYKDVPHLLIRGLARIGGTDYRFRIDAWDGSAYTEVTPEQADTSLPILFKPMGSPVPEPVTFIASDADYVDYITELMGGFGVPSFFKEMRQEKQYLFLGMRFSRDTERMVMADITYASAEPRGWALIPEPTEKELRYCKKMGIEVVPAGIEAILDAKGVAA